MLISEVIGGLQRLLEEQGDLKVYVGNHDAVDLSVSVGWDVFDQTEGRVAVVDADQ